MDHMRTFGCIAFAKVPDSQRTKLEAKATKCVFLGYCEGTKTYRLMSLETKKIIRARDVTFCENSKVEDNLDDGPCWRSGDKPAIVDQSSKSPVIDIVDEDKDDKDGGDEEHIEDRHLKTKNGEKKAEATAVEDNASSSDRRYPERNRRPLGEWWKNHILPHGEEEYANVALLDAPLTIREAMSCDDANKWKQAMQEEYKLLMDNGTWELTFPPQELYRYRL